MKYRNTVLANKELACALAEYAVKLNSEYGVALIEFEEKDAPKIREAVIASKKGSENELSENELIYAIGKDKNLYVIDKDGIRKSDSFGLTSFGLLNRQYRSYCLACKNAARVSRKVEKAQKKDAGIRLIPEFTLSNYKKFTFVDKLSNNVSCRIKLCKKENRPIVFYFHGGGNGGNDNQVALYEFGLSRIGLTGKECTVIVPQRPNTYKTDEEVSESSRELIDYIADYVKADKNRVYVLGVSAGGRCTWNFAWKYPDYIACAISLAGENLNVADMDAEKLVRLKDVPLWIVHDETDNAVDIRLDDFCAEELRKIGGNIRYTRYNKYGHSVARPFYFKEKWVDWMFEQSLEKR